MVRYLLIKESSSPAISYNRTRLKVIIHLIKLEVLNMGAAGNKKPKKDKSGKHAKHVPAYQQDSAKQPSESMKGSK